MKYGREVALPLQETQYFTISLDIYFILCFILSQLSTSRPPLYKCFLFYSASSNRKNIVTLDQTCTGVPVAWLTKRYHARLSMSPSFCADCWLCTTWRTVLVPSIRSLNSVHIAYLPWIKERISFHIVLVKVSKIKSVVEPTGPSNRSLSRFS